MIRSQIYVTLSRAGKTVAGPNGERLNQLFASIGEEIVSTVISAHGADIPIVIELDGREFELHPDDLAIKIEAQQSRPAVTSSVIQTVRIGR